VSKISWCASYSWLYYWRVESFENLHKDPNKKTGARNPRESGPFRYVLEIVETLNPWKDGHTIFLSGQLTG